MALFDFHRQLTSNNVRLTPHISTTSTLSTTVNLAHQLTTVQVLIATELGSLALHRVTNEPNGAALLIPALRAFGFT